MKKVISFTLALILLLGLCACSTPAPEVPTTDSFTTEAPSAPTTESTTKPTTEATAEPTIKPTSEPTTKPTAEPTTKPTAEPTTKPTTEATTETIHTHSFSAATCTTPKTCSCGATEGNATGHNWSDATCSVPKTCSVCGATEGSTAGHSWKDATCTAPKTCSKCATTEGSATAHTWNNATCQAPKTCSICKKTNGTKAEHKYADGKCSFCGEEDIVNPKVYFNPVNYVSLEEREQEISVVELFWNGETYDLADTLYVKTGGDPDDFIDYKGERYYASGGGGPYFTYRLTDTYIEFIDPGDEPCAKYALQHDGSLRLIALEGGWSLPSLYYKGTLDELLSKLN